MIEFAWPLTLCALILPVVAACLPPAVTPRSGLWIPYYDALDDVDNATRTAARRRGYLGALAAFLALTIAAARPVIVGDSISVPRTGRDIMLAIDISDSMSKRDWSANATRMNVVKQVVGDFIDRRHGDRVGVIVFGSRAYLQTPLTFDLHAVRRFFDETVVGLAGPATALGDAIGLTIKHLRDTDANHKVMILISDGAANAGQVTAEAAADVARSAGLTVYTIGVGSLDIGTDANTDAPTYDEALLRTLAQSTGGAFYHARVEVELENAYRRLDAIEPAARDDDIVRDVRELYPWPLGVALALTLVIGINKLRNRLRQ